MDKGDKTMKARVKATGEIVDVAYLSEDKYGNKYYNVTTDTRTYRETELEMMFDKGDYFYTYDYWTHLEHQAAIAAMGGICGNTSYNESTWESMAEDAILAAHALVDKLKEKEE
jgi:hypothetical protein